MKKLLAILCGIASVFGALFFGMKLLGRFAKSSMRLELDEVRPIRLFRRV